MNYARGIPLYQYYQRLDVVLILGAVLISTVNADLVFGGQNLTNQSSAQSLIRSSGYSAFVCCLYTE